MSSSQHQGSFSSQSFWNRGSFRSGSNIGSNRSTAELSGSLSGNGPAYDIRSLPVCLKSPLCPSKACACFRRRLVYNIRHFDAELMPNRRNTLRKGSTCSDPSYPDVPDRKDFPSPGRSLLSTPSGSPKHSPVVLALPSISQIHELAWHSFHGFMRWILK